MLLKVLSSSSAGNCYILDNGREALVIECGVPFKEVKKAIDFDISRIVGCLVSHEHGDHAAHVNEVIAARIHTYMSPGTADALNVKVDTLCGHTFQFRLGNFSIASFRVQHDAAEPLGFLIHHTETGTVLFATDCAELPYHISGLNNILIECNHSTRIVENKLHDGKITEAESVRTLRNHLSYETCLQILLDNDLSGVNNIVLLHLSDGNSNASDFQAGVKEATGKTVYVADKGMTINLNKTPF